MKKSALLLAALLALMGGGPAAPVRHLEYAFAIYPTAKPNGGLYNGTMSVDILGTAPDGGMLVQASDYWYYTLRPRQSRQCEVYASGSVRCDDVPPYPTEAQLVLLPLLARDFLPDGSSTGPSSWQRKFTLSFANGLYVTAASLDLIGTPQNGGSTLIVTSTGVFRQLDRRERKALEEGRYVYDRATSIPIVVHEVRSPTPAASVYSQIAVDLQLMKDSAGTNAPAPQPQFQNNQLPPNGVPGAPLSAPLPKATAAP